MVGTWGRWEDDLGGGPLPLGFRPLIQLGSPFRTQRNFGHLWIIQ